MRDVARGRRFLKALEGGRPPGPPSSLTARAFVQRFGRKWTPAPLPPDVERGPERRCYKNAARLALRTALAYVEGYAAGHIGIEHAWCVDASGRVVDNTWPPDVPGPDEYFGVAFDIAAVVGVAARRGAGVGILFEVEAFFPWLMDELQVVLDPRWRSPSACR